MDYCEPLISLLVYLSKLETDNAFLSVILALQVTLFCKIGGVRDFGTTVYTSIHFLNCSWKQVLLAIGGCERDWRV